MTNKKNAKIREQREKRKIEKIFKTHSSIRRMRRMLTHIRETNIFDIDLWFSASICAKYVITKGHGIIGPKLSMLTTTMYDDQNIVYILNYWINKLTERLEQRKMQR
jgi:hypothetical protein